MKDQTSTSAFAGHALSQLSYPDMRQIYPSGLRPWQTWAYQLRQQPAAGGRRRPPSALGSVGDCYGVFPARGPCPCVSVEIVGAATRSTGSITGGVGITT